MQRTEGIASSSRPFVSGAQPQNGFRLLKWQSHAQKIKCKRRSQGCRAQGRLQIVAQQPMLAPRTQDMHGDPFGLLLSQRIVFMGGEVNDFMADAIISQLLLLDAQDPTKDIKLFVNSPGGSVTAGMGIYDAMQEWHFHTSIRVPAGTPVLQEPWQEVLRSNRASMGAFILGAGAKGKRSSMPNARIMIHQPLGGASGQAVDLEIQAKEIMYHKANLNRIMSEYTGQPIEKIEDDTDRDRYMSPLEAKQYGLIDEIIGGDEAGFQIQGDTRHRPMTKEEYIDWWKDDEDEESGVRGSRFKGRPVEPFTKPLADE